MDAKPQKAVDVDEMEGLFVDAAPSKKSKASRASDRRREQGRAPQPAGTPDTRSMQREPQSQRPGSGVSELRARDFAKCSLTCTRGPEEGLALALAEGSYTVGRARENAFVLKDLAASRRHLRIDVDGRGARVIDLGSGNGTRVNGKRIGEHELRHGDRIEIGGSVLLFQEKGKPKADPNAQPVDDAQERVIRAAEKLAAELSERMRFDAEPASGFEDGHVAKTRAIAPAQKREIDAEVARARAALAAQQQAQQKPERLWKETFTNLPLNQVIPADEPLRGPRTNAENASPMQPMVAQRAPLPRPMPLAMPPPPPFEEIELSDDGSRGGSFMMSLLVTALVVVIGGGAVAGAYIYRHRGADVEAVNEEETQKQYDEAISRCDKALDAEDWASALEYSTAALQLHKDSKDAARYQREARKHLPPAPSPAPPAAAPAAAPAVPAAAPVQAVAAPAVAAPPPAPAAPVAAPAPAPKAKARQASVSSSSGASSARAAAKDPGESAPAPKAKARSSRGGNMSDDAAQARFEDAVNALRDKDNKKGCKILEEISDKASPDSKWKDKADNLYERRCP